MKGEKVFRSSWPFLHLQNDTHRTISRVNAITPPSMPPTIFDLPPLPFIDSAVAAVSDDGVLAV